MKVTKLITLIINRAIFGEAALTLDTGNINSRRRNIMSYLTVRVAAASAQPCVAVYCFLRQSSVYCVGDVGDEVNESVDIWKIND